MSGALDGHRLTTLIEAARIHDEVVKLAARIEAEYVGQPLTVLGILKGSVFFLVDLIRQIRVPLTLDFLRASSYGSGTVSSGHVTLGEFEGPLDGRHVLIVDDILDSGRTLRSIVEAVKERRPLSIRTCVLVDKRKERAVEFEADYAAFQIPDVFIVGYGLDFDEQYRNLPHIAVLDPGGGT